MIRKMMKYFKNGLQEHLMLWKNVFTARRYQYVVADVLEMHK